MTEAKHTEVRHKNAAEQMGYTIIPNAVMLNDDLSMPAKFLYGLLKHFAWHGGAPGQRRLGEMLGVGERSVRDYLAELESAGLVTRIRRGLGMTNLYEIIQPTAPRFRSQRAVAAAQDVLSVPVSTRRSTKLNQGSGSESPYPPDVTDEDLAAGLAEIQRFRSGGSD